MERLNLSPEELRAYSEFLMDQESFHKLFGHPDPLQGEMEAQCRLVSGGLDRESIDSARAKTLVADADQWRLLLQLDSDEAIGFEWEDWGRLYFWYRISARKPLTKTWTILQSC